MSEVFLVIDSNDLSATDLRTLIGAHPDAGWNVGDIHDLAGRERVCNFSRWSMVEHAPAASQIEDAADRLVDRLRPLEEKILALPPGQRVAFSICLDQENTVFGVGLSAKATAFIGRLGAEIDISVVVHRGTL